MTAPSSSREAPVILDTDLGNDCDDAGALAVLHALADMGEARILAVGCQKQDEWGAPAVDAINAYYGRPDIPVGQRAGIVPGSARKERLRYTEHLARNFPNRLKNGRHEKGDRSIFPERLEGCGVRRRRIPLPFFPEVTALYRQVLAAQPDHSVVFCAIGPLSNLKSLPNEFSRFVLRRASAVRRTYLPHATEGREWRLWKAALQHGRSES